MNNILIERTKVNEISPDTLIDASAIDITAMGSNLMGQGIKQYLFDSRVKICYTYKIT